MSPKHTHSILTLVQGNAGQRALRTPTELRRDGTTGLTAAPGVVRRLWAVGEPVTPEDATPLALVQQPATENPTRLRPELAFYRKYTEALLRRWVTLSMSPGRVPSLLGRELFRSKVSSHRMQSFDDGVIFCVDMERMVDKLSAEERSLIRRIAVQGYSQAEAAGLLGLTLRDIVRRYAAAIDRLTGILLAAGMLEPLRSAAARAVAEAEAKRSETAARDAEWDGFGDAEWERGKRKQEAVNAEPEPDNAERAIHEA